MIKTSAESKKLVPQNIAGSASGLQKSGIKRWNFQVQILCPVGPLISGLKVCYIVFYAKLQFVMLISTLIEVKRYQFLKITGEFYITGKKNFVAYSTLMLIVSFIKSVNPCTLKLN